MFERNKKARVRENRQNAFRRNNSHRPQERKALFQSLRHFILKNAVKKHYIICCCSSESKSGKVRLHVFQSIKKTRTSINQIREWYGLYMSIYMTSFSFLLLKYVNNSTHNVLLNSVDFANLLTSPFF